MHGTLTCEPFLLDKERAKGKKSIPAVAIIEEEEPINKVFASLVRARSQFRPKAISDPKPRMNKANFNDKLTRPSVLSRDTQLSFSLLI